MVDKSVEVKTYPSIEHGALLSVTSIVLHRTDSSTAASVLNAYKSGQKTGAHFLIEKDGKIYQTASLERICWHVGILSRAASTRAPAIPRNSRTSMPCCTKRA